MQTIQTATGKQYEVLWCGVSSLSGGLFFDLVDDRAPATIVKEFADPKNTIRIVYGDGNETVVYDGYTSLECFARKNRDSVRIELHKAGV